ncbi:kelch repeat and BTB domain-containing protein 2-like [Branchiostoma lanceolatum]|uniref:kelch repeat and BTB domain-containing protein 2-like n=1 Tax=Branchiostoma lanceolatum TaxID=7740 RepID=UPI00345533E9
MAAADQETHASAVRPRSYQDESYLHGFLGTVSDLQKAGVLQDVILEVEGRRFPCHRLVLSAASPYFRAMFTNDMAESRQKTVVLQGLDAGIFWEILSYIYSGTLHVSLDKVQPLYQAADLLQLDNVKDTCSSYMAMNVERSTCVDLYKFADVFSVDSVLKASLLLISSDFTEVASSDEFCSLSVNQLTEIISHDELDVKEETTVWEAVVRWVQHSREDRLHHLPDIIPHIRFNLLTSDETTAIWKHPLVRKDPGSSEVIRNVVQKGNPDSRPRLGMTTEMALLSRIKSDELLFMNPREGKYISCSYDPGDIPEVTAMTVTSDNNIYILTDEKELESNGKLSVFRYNHTENVWEPAGMSSVSGFKLSEDPSILASHEHYLVEVEKQTLCYLVVEGKVDSTLVQIKKYNRHTDQWQECPQLQVDGTSYIHLSAPLFCDSHLYFLANTEVHRFDPSQNQWHKRTPLMTIPEVCTAVAMGTEIFCTDFHFTQTMVYDTVTGNWQELQGWSNRGNLDMDVRPSFFLLENKLHVLLGVYDTVKQGPLTDYLIYVYDRSADAWKDLKATLPSKRYIACRPRCPVARMYLPYLKGAQKHITSYGFQH